MSYSSLRNVLPATGGMRSAAVAVCVAQVMAIAGCVAAQYARPSAMNPTTLVTPPRLGGAVALTVDASALTGVWQKRSLSGQSLREGIGGALVQHGVFDKLVTPEDDRDFILNIEVRSLTQPSVGLLPWWSSSLSTVWSLHHARSGKLLLNEIIVTKATQTFPEGLLQGDRGLPEALVRDAIVAAIGRIDSFTLEGSTK
jgi:hypothetical protein